MEVQGFADRRFGPVRRCFAGIMLDRQVPTETSMTGTAYARCWPRNSLRGSRGPRTPNRRCFTGTWSASLANPPGALDGAVVNGAAKRTCAAARVWACLGNPRADYPWAAASGTRFRHVVFPGPVNRGRMDVL